MLNHETSIDVTVGVPPSLPLLRFHCYDNFMTANNGDRKFLIGEVFVSALGGWKRKERERRGDANSRQVDWLDGGAFVAAVNQIVRILT